MRPADSVPMPSHDPDATLHVVHRPLSPAASSIRSPQLKLWAALRFLNFHATSAAPQVAAIPMAGRRHRSVEPGSRQVFRASTSCCQNHSAPAAAADEPRGLPLPLASSGGVRLPMVLLRSLPLPFGPADVEVEGATLTGCWPGRARSSRCCWRSCASSIVTPALPAAAPGKADGLPEERKEAFSGALAGKAARWRRLDEATADVR